MLKALILGSILSTSSLALAGNSSGSNFVGDDSVFVLTPDMIKVLSAGQLPPPPAH